MERGICYTKERKPRPRRLETYDYKESKKKEEEAVNVVVARASEYIANEVNTRNETIKEQNAKIKDLQEKNKRLRAELKEAGATREQYRQLEEAVKDLRAKIRSKDMTILDLEVKYEVLEEDLKSQIKSLKTQNESLLDENEALMQDKGEKGLKIANLELLDDDAKNRIEKEASDIVQKELIASALKKEKGAGRIESNNVLCAGNIYEFYVMDFLTERPDSHIEEDLEIAKRAFPEKEIEFSSVSFATHIFIQAAKDNIMEALNRTQKFIKEIFEEKAKEIHEKILDELEEQIEEDYTHTYTHHIMR
jgi:hypothetical protein